MELSGPDGEGLADLAVHHAGGPEAGDAREAPEGSVLVLPRPAVERRDSSPPASSQRGREEPESMPQLARVQLIATIGLVVGIVNVAGIALLLLLN
ncbi:hypothetical protein J0910_30235 [Nocardiopsis sp. CNT-189]|uniref:hypothetical protein n=1 Tax=Nocardiopsis oceanisediminis TaxID=2816862 RepID=UPI003B2AB8EC